MLGSARLAGWTLLALSSLPSCTGTAAVHGHMCCIDAIVWRCLGLRLWGFAAFPSWMPQHSGAMLPSYKSQAQGSGVRHTYIVQCGCRLANLLLYAGARLAETWSESMLIMTGSYEGAWWCAWHACLWQFRTYLGLPMHGREMTVHQRQSTAQWVMTSDHC